MSSITNYNPSNSNSYSFSHNWIELHTAKNIQYIVSNILFNRCDVYFPCVAMVNVPLRALNCFNAFQDKQYWKIAFDSISFLALFSCLGIPGSITIDFISEGVNQYCKRTQFSRQDLEGLDCTKKENALKVFNLSENDLTKEVLLDRYEKLCHEYDGRIEKLKDNKLLQGKLLAIRRKVELSYKTLESFC